MSFVLASIGTILVIATMIVGLFMVCEGKVRIPCAARHPVVAVFIGTCAGLSGLTLCVVLLIFFWTATGIFAENDAHVGDIRCQRYETQVVGKTVENVWRTITCVDITNGG